MEILQMSLIVIKMDHSSTQCTPAFMHQMYGATRCLPEQMVPEATRKKELCEDILSVLSVLVPGMNYDLT